MVTKKEMNKGKVDGLTKLYFCGYLTMGQEFCDGKLTDLLKRQLSQLFYGLR